MYQKSFQWENQIIVFLLLLQYTEFCVSFSLDEMPEELEQNVCLSTGHMP